MAQHSSSSTVLEAQREQTYEHPRPHDQLVYNFNERAQLLANLKYACMHIYIMQDVRPLSGCSDYTLISFLKVIIIIYVL